MYQDRRERARAHWRGLNELADTPELRGILEREFPAQAEDLKDAHSRRAFLQVMGASLSMMGLAGCRWPERRLLPFAGRPAGRIPGMPAQYATAMELDGAALGLLVTSVDGRPIKIEGNPSHPTNGAPGDPDPRGTADVFTQASVLGLYDPDRSQGLLRREGRAWFESTEDEFLAFAASQFAKLSAGGGEGLRVLSEGSASPTFAILRDRFRQRFPRAFWHEFEPLSRDAERAGAALVFGRPLRMQWNLGEAKVIVSLDSDFLRGHPAALRHARDFAAVRRPEGGRMSRLHVVECAYSVTGAKADHRYALPAAAIPLVAARLGREILSTLGHDVYGALDGALERYGRNPAPTPFVAGMVRDLLQARGSSLITVGPQQPEAVHALAHIMNAALGNTGRTITYTNELDPGRPSHIDSIRDLAAAIGGGQVKTLLILGGNPVYTAPVDLEFEALLAKVPTSIHLSLYRDETTQACTRHLPRAHYLESWDDTRAWDGTVSIVQPLIDPLYGGKTPSELLAILLGQSTVAALDLVRRTWQEAASTASAADHASVTGADFESFWRASLEQGIVPGTAFPEIRPVVRTDELVSALSTLDPPSLDFGPHNLEIVFCPDLSVHDGRFANNGWLQETPDALTKLTWDNAVLLSPATAGALGVRADDVVTLRYRSREIKMAVYVMPGQAPFSAAVALGYGRTHAGRVGTGPGFNVYRLRTSDAPHHDGGLTLSRTGEIYNLACTQEHHTLDAIGRKGMAERVPILIREGTVEEYKANPGFAREEDQSHPPLVSLWREHEYNGHRWGMAIDLNACTGCNACVVACVAENNVPIVGKRRVAQGREMQWIRVDRYFVGDPDAPEVAYQPMACAHCENAPCEQVCPVGATVHDGEGLNVMVYNRCIGTRYCSNNCPFKVRRFNFSNYRHGLTPQQKMAYNPEVTIRSRGVMEKCTYCVQRIETVKIAAKNERRSIRDGEIVPACAQTCPSGAIVFGDLNDPESRVAKLHAQPRAYVLLEELNIKPRTSYLARLRNPAGGEAHEG
jgi:MoCo/4Fe-4S cofactor protein with predicted Tat translocation signal